MERRYSNGIPGKRSIYDKEIEDIRMQMKLKTEFWKNKDPEEWRKRYLKTNEGTTLVLITILAGMIFKIPILIAATAITMLIISIIITITHNRYKRKLREEEEKQHGNSKDTNTDTREEEQSKENRSTVQETQETTN